MDHLTKEQRHKNMLANKSKGTKIELLLGRMMWNAGLRYRKNDSSLPGTPDFTIRKAHVAIFCDGEFWHGHNWEVRKEDIKSNRDFWYAKIERNIEHDRMINDELRNRGWKVFRFWENDIRSHPELCLRDITDYIHIIESDKRSPSYTYGRACNKLNLYGPHSYNKDGSIMSVSDQMALVSHYIHNYGNESAEKYATEGYGLVEDTREYTDECTMVCEDDLRTSLYNESFSSSFPPVNNPSFTFIDLFSGIGGMRMALQRSGGRCVFSSEWNPDATRVYFNNFGEAPFGDITKEESKTYIPECFDVLSASLHLQAFALSHRRNNFEKIKGTLFSDTAEIIRRREPKAVLLEFPYRQLNYSKGEYTRIILDVLSRELNYYVKEPVVMNASDYSSALDKSFMYIVAFREETDFNRFVFPSPNSTGIVFDDVMEKEPVSASYYLSAKRTDDVKVVYNIINTEGKVRLSEHSVVKDMRTIDILPDTRKLNKINRKGLRRLTQNEILRLYGFPDAFSINTSKECFMLLMRNATVPPMVYEIAKKITESISVEKHTFRYGK